MEANKSTLNWKFDLNCFYKAKLDPCYIQKMKGKLDISVAYHVDRIILHIPEKF